MQGEELVGQRVAFYGYSHTRPANTPIIERPIAYVPTEIATTLYTTGRELNPTQPDRTTLSVDELLMPYRQGDLDQIGRRFGLTVQTYCSRNEVRAVIADNVTQADAVHYALTQLLPSLSEFYQWLIARGGRATTDEVQRKMRWDVPALLAALRTFEEYAIAFDAFSEGQRVIFIPARTFDNLRRAHARPVPEATVPETTAPRSVRPADHIILWDVAAFVAGVVGNDIDLTRANALPKRTAQRLMPLITNEWVRSSDELAYPYLSQLQSEALDLGIIQITTEEDHHRLDLGVKLDVWTSQDIRMQTHRILRRWVHNRHWRDQVGTDYGGWMASSINVLAAREALLNLLRNCEPGTWYAARPLLRKLLEDDPFVLRPNQRYNGHGGFKVADDIRAHWDDTDGEVLLGMLKSTLYELGIVSLGYHSETLPPTRAASDPDMIALTELGAEVLRGDLGLAPTPTEHPLVVQPNFEILLLEPHMPALYWLLRCTQPEQIGQASRFKVTREALLRSMNEGTTLDDILAFLVRHSQKELPQNVIYTLHDWSRQYKETRLSRVVLIEVDNEQLATEICESVKLRELGLRRVGPCALATPEGAAVRAVRRAIERAGYSTQTPEVPAAVTTSNGSHG
ncbi:MAG: helicase-associated domain-containing protein [Ktedonobacterales bacterium]|nr:helicase-associated domain-containing protein [Ktedonobacterales bacterium]